MAAGRLNTSQRGECGDALEPAERSMDARLSHWGPSGRTCSGKQRQLASAISIDMFCRRISGRVDTCFLSGFRLDTSENEHMAPLEGPDFICVGMAKAGTSWLFDQLQYHPDFWMPPVKELQYLNHPFPKLKNVEKHLRLLERRAARARMRARSKRRPGDARDNAFLRDAQALSGRPMDICQYAALFRHKGNLLSGDISPPYAALSDEVVVQVARLLPNVRVLLLVRDPVERAWSNLCMGHRRGNVDSGLLDDPIRFRSFFEEEKLDDRLFPTKIVERWSRCAPNVRFRHVLFDDISSEADRVRQEILLFLGANPDKDSGELPPHYNRKANAAKLVLSDAIKAILVEHFQDELRACADLFGGRAQDWMTRYEL